MRNCLCIKCTLVSVGLLMTFLTLRLFLPICATFHSQTFTVKCVIMKLLFPLKPVSNLMHL